MKYMEQKSDLQKEVTTMAELWAWNIANEMCDSEGRVWTFKRCPKKLKKKCAKALKEMGAGEYITDPEYK